MNYGADCVGVDQPIQQKAKYRGLTTSRQNIDVRIGNPGAYLIETAALPPVEIAGVSTFQLSTGVTSFFSTKFVDAENSSWGLKGVGTLGRLPTGCSDGRVKFRLSCRRLMLGNRPLLAPPERLKETVKL